jgi:predicted deacylase
LTEKVFRLSKISWLKIGGRGVLNLDIPVYSIGSGNPVLGITCSVHGDETAGLFIIDSLLKSLHKYPDLKGTIHIIPAANPAAQFMNSRVAFFDHKDLNRVGSGRSDGSYTEKVAAELFTFLSKCDAVINIHEFEMKTPVTGIFDNAGSKEVQNSIFNLLKVFSPELIWVIDQDQASDVQYQTTLDMALTRAGVINFPIETSQLALLPEADILRAAQGLLNVAAHLGIIDEVTVPGDSEIPALIRNETSSSLAGLWEPVGGLTLMQDVKENELIGTVKTIPDFQEQKIFAGRAGTLMQIRHRQLVSTGSSLFSIGNRFFGASL